MKIVRVLGGLGNQMFQYAFALKLKHMYPNEKIWLDLSGFSNYEWHKYELGYVFNVDIPICRRYHRYYVTRHLPFICKGVFSGKKNYIEESRDKLYGFDEKYLNVPGDGYFWGGWFNEDYFKDISNEVRSAFTFKTPLGIQDQSLVERINNTNSVSIHVRRGNYLLWDMFKNICEEDYYERAINYIKTKVNNPYFYIFTNDRQWCENNIVHLLENYSYSPCRDEKTNYIDMQIMSYCKHNIIAHSTFSWWAAWLNNNPDKIVVSPSKWLNDDSVKHKPQLSGWILL